MQIVSSGDNAWNVKSWFLGKIRKIYIDLWSVENFTQNAKKSDNHIDFIDSQGISNMHCSTQVWKCYLA